VGLGQGKSRSGSRHCQENGGATVTLYGGHGSVEIGERNRYTRSQAVREDKNP
jgi:hypothetical protein